MRPLADLLRGLLHASSEMREAAAREDWERLGALWADAQPAFDELRQRLDDSNAGREVAGHHADIARLLADIAAIEQGAEPWLAATGRLLARWQRAAGAPTNDTPTAE